MRNERALSHHAPCRSQTHLVPSVDWPRDAASFDASAALDVQAYDTRHGLDKGRHNQLETNDGGILGAHPHEEAIKGPAHKTG